MNNKKIITIGLLIFCIALFSCQSVQLKENIVIEAGSPVPDVEEFYINPATKGKYITNTAKIDTKKLGSETIEIEIGNKKYASTLTIEDTIPPKAEPIDVYIFHDNEIIPENLVAEVEDETRVSFAFFSPPDYEKYGWQDITVVLTDEGGNSTNIVSKLYIFDKAITDEFVFEVGVPHNMRLSDFVSDHLDADEIPEIIIEADELPFSLDEEIYFPHIESYQIKLTMGNYSTSSTLIARDTTPPKGKPSPEYQYIFKGNTLDAKELVVDIEDATKVSCVFDDEKFSYEPGWQEIAVRLVDEANNSSVIISKYYVFEVTEELVVEAGTRNSVSPKDFIKNYIETGTLTLEIANPINYLIPGKYPVKLKSGKHEYSSVVSVQDTTPPTAETKNIWTYINKPVQVTAFVYDIKDVSAVTIKYKTQPDFSVAGTQTVYISIEDAYNNSSEFAALLTVINDTTPPVISGDLNKRVAVGGTVAYRAGVSVTDDYDANVQFSVDSSGVNLNVAGVYTVIYSATDESGNRAQVQGSVTVFVIDMALVNAMADDILAQIIGANMSQLDKARAIYSYVDRKMKYTATNTKRDIAQRAYDCFTKGSGDCYTYMAASHVLLTRAGIDNRIVSRIPEASTPHYWNLVNTGTGWHHFDACPSPTSAVGYNQRFMFTESQAQSYTQIITGRDHYYDYDKSTVPEVVE